MNELLRLEGMNAVDMAVHSDCAGVRSSLRECGAYVAIRWAGTARDQGPSAEEIQGYLSGSGLGLAKTAELHHYPGPRHVLALAVDLGLSDEQRRQTQTIFEAMQTEAMRLGQQLIARERHLETLFATGTYRAGQLEQLVANIASIHGQLRAVHLRAHLAQKTILSPSRYAIMMS